MKVEKKELEKSQIELLVELEYGEFDQYVKKAAQHIAEEIKIDGFRPGKAPYEIVKQKVGDMTILEEAGRIAINKTIDEVIKQQKDIEPVGHPKVDIVKLAPNNPFEYKVVIALMPKVEIGDYKDAKVKAEKVKVEKLEVDKLIADLREMRVKEVIAEREIGEGDKVIIDIRMFLDKVPVEGGQGNEIAVIIGKEYFIPGFDKQLLGAKRDDKREFELPYPSDHFQKHLAGKRVEFEVKIKGIYERQLPDLNDDFASGFGVKNMEELEENIKKSMEDEKKHELEHKAEGEIFEKIIEKSVFGEIPEVLIENESRAMIGELEQDIKNRGGKFEEYLESLKKTKDELTLELLPNAIKRVKSALIVREIADKEKIAITEEEIDSKIEDLIKRYKGYEKVEERVKNPSYRSYLYSLLVNQKVVKKLMEWNLEK